MNVRIKYCLNTEPVLTLTLVDCHFWVSGDCIYTRSIGTECISSGHSCVWCASSLVVVKVLLKRRFYATFANCLHQSAVCIQCQLQVLPNAWTLNTAPHTLFYGLVILCLYTLKARSCSAIWKSHWFRKCNWICPGHKCTFQKISIWSVTTSNWGGYFTSLFLIRIKK
jgi:hypothetical protein